MVKKNANYKLTLHGWSANNNLRAAGYAFLASDPDDARRQILAFKDDNPRILVCSSLDWSWSDVANEVVGVITDHGTRVSRGSEVSGIVQVAAVLGTKKATNLIQNDDYIEIICEGNEAIAKIFSSPIPNDSKKKIRF